MGDLVHLSALGSLGFDEVGDQLLGEYAVCGEVIVVGLKGIERLGKGGRQTLELGLFLLGETEEVEVVGTPALGVRINFVF